jgi:hypothetical protein
MELDFLVVGAAKSGTTALYEFLKNDSRIVLPQIKETGYFGHTSIVKGHGAENFVNSRLKTMEEFKASFISVDNRAVYGEISNEILYYHESSIERIKSSLNNEPKIILILRNPIERAYSNYLHHVREGWEPLTFKKALEQEEFRIENGYAWPYHYLSVGKYYVQVKAFMDNFQNVSVLLYDDIFTDRWWNEFYGSLEIDLDTTMFQRGSRLYNVGGKVRLRMLQHALTRPNPVKSLSKNFLKILGYSNQNLANIGALLRSYNLSRVPINSSDKEWLVKNLRDDIDNLSQLVGRDLSYWYEEE